MDLDDVFIPLNIRQFFNYIVNLNFKVNSQLIDISCLVNYSINFYHPSESVLFTSWSKFSPQYFFVFLNFSKSDPLLNILFPYK